HRAAQRQKLVAQALHLHEDDRVGIVDRRALQVLDALAELLDHREVGVDHGVDDQIGEVIGADLAHAAAALADGLAHEAEESPSGRSCTVMSQPAPKKRLTCSSATSPSASRIVRSTTNMCLS